MSACSYSVDPEETLDLIILAVRPVFSEVRVGEGEVD